MNKQACKNCDQPLPKQAAFCSSCGQSVREVKQPWLKMLKDLLEEVFDFDGRMLRSIRLLLIRPGFLSQEYSEGRRASYTSPVRMYLVVSLLFFLVLPLILPEANEMTSEEHKFSADLYSKAMFLLLPLFALLMKGFYRRSYYLEHLVFTAYLFSAMFIGFAATMSIESLADQYLGFILLQVSIMIAMIIYAIAALKKAYGGTWTRSGFKFLGLLLAFLPFLALSIELASHGQGLNVP